VNIIVTVPKREYRNLGIEDVWAGQQKEGVIQFWSMARLPKDLTVGDRVYFIQDGAVRYWHECLGKSDTGLDCEATGRTWEGPAILLKYPDTKLKIPVSMKGFQGFRYTTESWE
jgi:hypothetical protein